MQGYGGSCARLVMLHAVGERDRQQPRRLLPQHDFHRQRLKRHLCKMYVARRKAGRRSQ